MKIKCKFQSQHRTLTVAQSGTLLYRRLAVGTGNCCKTAVKSERGVCRLPACDTADWQSAPRLARHTESGLATVLFIALLAIMMVLVMVESRSIIRLHQEVKLMEQQQIKRLNSPATNAVSAVTIP